MPPEDDELNLEGVFDDDPEIPDEEEAGKAEEGDETDQGDQESEETQDGQAADGKEQEAGKGQPAAGTSQQAEAAQQAEPQPAQAQPLFTQADVERIIGERLARDRRVQTVRELETVAGKPLEQIVQEYRERRLQEITERYGVDEEEAKSLLEREEKARQFEAEYRELEARQNALQRLIWYHHQKMQHLGNPLAKRYEKEVDEFSQYGTYTDFGTALAYVLGQKLLSGDLMRDLQTAAEQRTIANIERRSRAAPEAGAQARPAGEALTPEEKRLAIALGVSPKEYAAEKSRMRQARRRG